MSRTVEERLAALERTVATMRANAPPSEKIDLTSPYANFVVRKSPKNWLASGGHDYAGECIASTSPEFCEALAEFLDWQASKDEAKNYSYVNAKGTTVFPAKYARTDAARCRAWAERMRDDAARLKGKHDADAGELPF